MTTLSPVVATAKKEPKITAVVDNPLHNFASYTYNWSLWWLDLTDYNYLMEQSDVTSALSYQLSNKSFVVAQDSGLHPDRRQPGTRGLNYHIQDLQFDTVIAPNKTSRSSNLITGAMTILEPYGVTLIDTLIAAGFDGQKYNNYTEQTYLLELEFRGYDDNGRPVPEKDTVLFKKRFPVRIVSLKAQVTGRGAEYKLAFVPAGHRAHDTENSTTPKNFTITAGTVREFFNQLTEQYFDFNKDAIDTGKIEYADFLSFDIDPAIADSKIVNEKKVPWGKGNSKATAIELNKNTFNIPRGTPILDIITRVMAHSSYLIELQLQLEKERIDLTLEEQQKIFNSFKTLTSVIYKGTDGSGSWVYNVFDRKRNTRPKFTTYKIHQYSTWTGNHPNLPLFSDSVSFTSKEYNYFYTGQNTDVIDFKINFDTTYYNGILAFTSAIGAYAVSNSTDQIRLQAGADDFIKPGLRLNPAIFVANFPALGAIPNVTPLRYKMLVGDQNVTTGINVARPEAQVAADVIKSLYTSMTGDMVSLNMTIVGDPTLIKQDDWLYVPSPTSSTNYNDWEISQAEFASRFGHIRTDTGEVVVRVRINSPIDADLDITNRGLAYPEPAYSPSLFSGQYKIVRINNKFSGGKFEQVLDLVRYINSDYVTAINAARESVRSRDAVNTGQRNDQSSVPTNDTQSGSAGYAIDESGRGLI